MLPRRTQLLHNFPFLTSWGGEQKLLQKAAWDDDEQWDELILLRVHSYCALSFHEDCRVIYNWGSHIFPYTVITERGLHFTRSLRTSSGEASFFLCSVRLLSNVMSYCLAKSPARIRTGRPRIFQRKKEGCRPMSVCSAIPVQPSISGT